MDKSFKIDWISKETGFKYFMIITPAGRTSLGHSYYGDYQADIPNLYDTLEEGLISKCDMSWEYEDSYPFGMPSANSMKLTFNLTNTINDDFKNIMFNQFYDFGENISFTQATKTFTFKYEYRASNVYRLFCDYGVGTNYKEIYIGMQKSGLGGHYSPITKELTIELFDINRCILESLNLSFLRELQNSKFHIARRCYFDWVYTWDTSPPQLQATICVPAANMNARTNAYFWYYNLGVYFDYLIAACKKIGSLLTRNASFEYTIEYDMPTLFKQTYNKLGNTLGAELSKGDLYIIGFVTNQATYSGTTKFYGGLFYNSLEKEYKTLWDYLSEFAVDNLLKYFFIKKDNIYTLTAIPITTATGLTEVMSLYDGENLISNLEVKFDYEILKKVESSNQETIGQDVSKIEQINNSSRSEKSKAAMIIHNNVPSGFETGKNWRLLTNSTDINSAHVLYDNPMNFKFSDSYFKDHAQIRYSWQNRIKTLFYFDTPSYSGHDMTTIVMPIRIHNYNYYKFGAFVTGITEIYPYSNINFNDMTLEQQPPGTVEAIYIQNNQSKNIAQVKALLKIFSKYSQIGVSGEVNFKSCIKDNYSIFLYPTTALYINLTTLDDGTLFTDYERKFYLHKVEIDLIKEIVKFEAITITENPTA